MACWQDQQYSMGAARDAERRRLLLR